MSDVSFTKFILNCLFYVFIGALVMAGMKAVDHLIPNADRNLVICVEPVDTINDCVWPND